MHPNLMHVLRVAMNHRRARVHNHPDNLHPYVNNAAVPNHGVNFNGNQRLQAVNVLNQMLNARRANNGNMPANVQQVVAGQPVVANPQQPAAPNAPVVPVAPPMDAALLAVLNGNAQPVVNPQPVVVNPQQPAAPNAPLVPVAPPMNAALLAVLNGNAQPVVNPQPVVVNPQPQPQQPVQPVVIFQAPVAVAVRPVVQPVAQQAPRVAETKGQKLARLMKSGVV